MTELKMISDLTEVIEIVEIVMKFLQRKGDNPKRKIKDFIEDDLQTIGKLRSKKVHFCDIISNVVNALVFQVLLFYS